MQEFPLKQDVVIQNSLYTEMLLKSPSIPDAV